MLFFVLVVGILSYFSVLPCTICFSSDQAPPSVWSSRIYAYLLQLSKRKHKVERHSTKSDGRASTLRATHGSHVRFWMTSRTTPISQMPGVQAPKVSRAGTFLAVGWTWYLQLSSFCVQNGRKIKNCLRQWRRDEKKGVECETSSKSHPVSCIKWCCSPLRSKDICDVRCCQTQGQNKQCSCCWCLD